MLTIEQIKMARALLGWDQGKLAKASGVSIAQIANIESGKAKSPRVGTLTAIRDACIRSGAEFKDDGVFPKVDPTIKFEGDGWYVRLLDYVYQELVDIKSPDIIVLFGDESKSSPEIMSYWKKIKELGGKMRRIVRDGDTHLSGALNEYRYMPAKFFNNYVIIIFAGNVAICTVNNTMALVINDAPLADSYTLQTDFHFSILNTPTESTADVHI